MMKARDCCWIRRSTQGPSWRYLKVNSSENLSIFGEECPQNGSKNDLMVPRTTMGCPHEGPRVVSDQSATKFLYLFCRRQSSKPSGKCWHDWPTRGTVCGTLRSMCGADAGCLAINYQSRLSHQSASRFSYLVWRLVFINGTRNPNPETHSGFGFQFRVHVLRFRVHMVDGYISGRSVQIQGFDSAVDPPGCHQVLAPSLAFGMYGFGIQDSVPGLRIRACMVDGYTYGRYRYI